MRRRRGLGDAAPAYNPGWVGASVTTTLTAEQAAAAAGSDFAKNAADELSHQTYAQAVAQGVVPSYITAPADQAKFVSLMNVINGTGFSSLSPEDQVAFNALRNTGTQDIDAPQVGGSQSGDYQWDPSTGQGDAPPNADVIAKVIAAHNDPNYSPPPVSTERAINLSNGRYVYADDGSLVPQSELDRLGLKITVSPPPPSPAPPVVQNALDNANPGSSMAPSSTADISGGMTPTNPTNLPVGPVAGSGMFGDISPTMIGVAALGVGALVFFAKRKKGR
jgi:hypothetical protein